MLNNILMFQVKFRYASYTLATCRKLNVVSSGCNMVWHGVVALTVWWAGSSVGLAACCLSLYWSRWVALHFSYVVSVKTADHDWTFVPSSRTQVVTRCRTVSTIFQWLKHVNIHHHHWCRRSLEKHTVTEAQTRRLYHDFTSHLLTWCKGALKGVSVLCDITGGCGHRCTFYCRTNAGINGLIDSSLWQSLVSVMRPTLTGLLFSFCFRGERRQEPLKIKGEGRAGQSHSHWYWQQQFVLSDTSLSESNLTGQNCSVSYLQRQTGPIILLLGLRPTGNSQANSCKSEL